MNLYIKTIPDPEIGDPYHITLDKTGNVLTITHTCTTQVSVLSTGTNGTELWSFSTGTNVMSTTVDLDVLHARQDCADGSVFFPVIQDGKFIEIPINGWAQTYYSKELLKSYINRMGYSVILGIGIPTASTTTNDYLVAVAQTSSNITLTGDIAIQNVDTGTAHTTGINLRSSGFKGYNHGMHQFIIGTPTIDSDTKVVSIPVTVPDTGTGSEPIDNTQPFSIHVSTTLGMLFQSEVPIVNGTGTIQISVFGFPPGLTGKVNIGYKFWSGKANAYFTT